MESLQHEEQLFGLIERFSGLTINNAHKNYMRTYIKKRLESLRINEKSFYAYVQMNDSERSQLIDEAAINETYFFREEKQFDFLFENFFGQNKSDKIVIWSAACSTGEEPISLYAMAHAKKRNAIIYATDIDQTALATLSRGEYTKHSLRTDGGKYHYLLDAIGSYDDKKYKLNAEVNENIKKSIFNLMGDDTAPVPKGSVDLLFLRNVFIYFSADVRKRVIRKMSDYLAMGGYLFLSVNDIASVECDEDVPLIKENCGPIYFFRKVDLATKARIKKERTEQIRAMQTKNAFANRQSRLAKNSSALEKARKLLASRHENALAKMASVTKEMRLAKSTQNVANGKTNLEQLAKDIFADLGKKEVSAAKEKILQHKFHPENFEYQAYLNGLIAQYENNDSRAVFYFKKANLYDPKFWPSYFKLGLIYDKLGNDKDRERAFSTCAFLLERYVKNREICYNFLMEQFSPSYFLNICKKYATA